MGTQARWGWCPLLAEKSEVYREAPVHSCWRLCVKSDGQTSSSGIHHCFHCPCSWGSHLSLVSPVPKLGKQTFPHCDLWGCQCSSGGVVLLQEHSGTLSSQQMSPLSTLQPSPFPSPQRSLGAPWSHTGQNPALAATCPLGEWQE